MKRSWILCLAMLTTSTSYAASVTALAQSLYLNITENCNSIVCNTSLKVKAKHTLQANILPAEAAGFQADTVINIDAPGLFTSFTPADDPGYQAGDTSIRISRSLDGLPNVSEKITLSWGSGQLVLSYALSGKAAVSTLHEDKSFRSTFPALPNSEKSHDIPPYNYTLTADNGGTEFLEVAASVLMDTVETEGVIAKATGEAQESTVLNLKSVSFGPPLP